MKNFQWFSVHFEAVSIQEYIFAGAKLKDMVSASELVDMLCGDPLTDAIKVLGLSAKNELPDNENDIAFPRAAGGAFVAILKSQEMAQRFMSLWSMIVPEFAPGLKFTMSMANGAKLVDCIKAGIKSQKAQKNVFRPSFPEITPIMERSPRTGQFVVAVSNKNPNNIVESLDAITAVKRQLSDVDKVLGIDAKFLPKNATHEGKTWVFPKCIAHSNKEQECRRQEAFPFNNNDGEVSGQHYVGLIHADGNGLGEFLHAFFEILKDKTDDQYYQAYSTFTQGLEVATLAAGSQATQQVFITASDLISEKDIDKMVIPMRPIILGGDDLTVICRADKAFEFAQAFVEAFEQQTKTLMQSFNIARHRKMTACAGIAFVKSNQPFFMAAHLAESLCSAAKIQSRMAIQSSEEKTIPSSLAFHLISNSLFEDAKVALNQELQANHEGETYQTTLGAYQIAGEANAMLPQFSQLQTLCECFGDEASQKLGIATLRHLATWVHADINRAKDVYARWKEVSNDQDKMSIESGAPNLKWQTWEQALRLFGIDEPTLPFKSQSTQANLLLSPISDVLAYAKMSAQGATK